MAGFLFSSRSARHDFHSQQGRVLETEMTCVYFFTFTLILNPDDLLEEVVWK